MNDHPRATECAMCLIPPAHVDLLQGISVGLDSSLEYLAVYLVVSQIAHCFPEMGEQTAPHEYSMPYLRVTFHAKLAVC